MAEPKTSQKTTAAATKQAQARQKLEGKKEDDTERLVDELEQRLDRLRVSYDQYFMGIEKVPPHVQLKDVERRLMDLRKVNIRNTALRYKFQTLVQKHSTYQSYWNRICRQIEEGTYKRDLRRAKERFDPAAKKAAARHLEDVEVTFEDDFANFDDLMSEMGKDAELERLLTDQSAPSAAEADDDDPDTIRPTLLGSQPATKGAPLRPREVDARSAPRIDDPDEGVPFVLPRGPIEERPSQKHLIRTDGRPATQAPSQAAPPERAPGKGLVAPISPLPGQRGYLRPIAPQAQGGQAARGPQPANPTQGASRPTAPSNMSARPAATPAQGANARPPLPPTPPASDPSGQKTSAPVRPPAAPGRPAASPRNEGDLSENRMRQLYSQYIEAKRAHQESTASVTYDSLAKSLRESSEKLKAKHGGKNVDFEVAVKDGKTILRPILKDK